MKRLALLVTLVCAVAGSVAIASALAGTPNPVAQTTGFACNVLGTSGSVEATTFQSSETLYASGKDMLHCVGQVTPDGAYHLFTGFGCGLIFTGVSFNPDNKDSVSKSGESQLTCFNDGFSAPASPGLAGAAQ
jgi:hypothetical protein